MNKNITWHVGSMIEKQRTFVTCAGGVELLSNGFGEPLRAENELSNAPGPVPGRENPFGDSGRVPGRINEFGDSGLVPGRMNGFGDSGRKEDLVGAGNGGVKLLSGEASNRTRERSESNSGLWTVV